MKNRNRISLAFAIGLVLCPGFVRISDAAETGGTESNASAAESRAQAQADIEKQRQQAEQDARKKLDKDAVAAIEETRKAIQTIAAGNTQEAIATIERATGKIDILTARNPAAAIIPVVVDVEVIDVAPLDVAAIKIRATAAEVAVDEKDYPGARTLLEGLISEMRVRTFNLPLATYPAAMKQAALLLDQQKTKEAAAVLTTALNTLVVIDRATPLPLEIASVAIAAAQTQADKDKAKAKALLATAKHEVERARQLGYAGKDPEYTALDTTISDLEKQIDGDQDTASAFSRLKEKFAAFFKRQSETETKAQLASR